ncbi:DUF1176 domain-containing protein [Aureimonas populi]|uniref:DUF1176 domain-containing protein n=1 Tax=Aureimonas populi TaxID=1701758 RepID=A0ABW5CM30_9HYPH|nr:DUF1176 domain-containing protein [Aureimonas populi]
MKLTDLARATPLLPLLLAAPAAAGEPGEMRSFGDWIAGCDNRLSCTAIGLSPEAAPVFAYLKVAREAGAQAEPTVSVSILDQLETGGPIGLALPDGTLPVTSLDVPEGADTSFAAAELGDVDHGAFLDALLPASVLDVSLGGDTVPVSLEGLSAALRYMDDVQGRAGGLTALVAKGEAAADSVTPAPPPVTVTAQPLSEIAEPGERPAALGAPEEYCPDNLDDLVFEAADGTRLWGVCSSAGAYNLSYDFWIVRDGTAEPADFGAFGQGFSGDGTSTLVNPTLMEDGLTITAFARGRGLGDCGAIASWAMDAGAPTLVESAVMGECRGVMPDDWPVLYRAELSTE